MLLFGADKRKGNEPKSSLRLRMGVSLVFTFALLAYVAFELYLIYNDGQDGFAVRTTIFTMKQYSMPDIVFCSDTNPQMTYTCDTIFADGTRVPGACSNLFSSTSTKYGMNMNSSFHYCYSFQVNSQLIFDQWNDSNQGIKTLQFNISVPTGQTAPDHLVAQLFDPAGNYYTHNAIESAYEDSVEIQAARVQNKYVITNGTQMSALYTTSLHQQLSKSDSLSILGLGASSLVDQHFLSSSADKVIQPQYAQQGLYGVVTVEPATYNTVIMQDQRRFTILTALGLLGGAYGAFASLFFFLFGEKQINPIGVVTRVWTHAQPTVDPYPTSTPMHQRNLLAGQIGSPSSQDNDTIMATSSRKSAEALEEGGVRRQLSQKHQANFIETREELPLAQRVKELERLLNDYVVNLDQVGIKMLGNF